MINFKSMTAHLFDNKVNPKLNNIVEIMFQVLSEKEKIIIKRRYGLGIKEYETLEKIGRTFNVSRERIRQIEAQALQKLKRHVVHTPIKNIHQIGKKILEDAGGLIEEEKLYRLMEEKLPLKPDRHYLKLSLELDTEILQCGNTGYFKAHWKLSYLSEKEIKRLSDDFVKMLEKENKVLLLSEATKRLPESEKKYNETFFNELFEIDKRIKLVKEGLGLRSWAHINPQNVREKIFYILHRETKPLHFRMIAKKMEEYAFDKKRVNKHTIHNELIRNENLIHVGRGVYALKEWGYEKGSVKDIIVNILKREHRPITKNELIEAVQKQRLVKESTVLLNFKELEGIERIGRNHYQMSE